MSELKTSIFFNDLNLSLYRLSVHQHEEIFKDNDEKNSIENQENYISNLKPEYFELLQNFYNNLMLPNFPVKEELETFEEFIYLLTKEAKENIYSPLTHFLFLIDNDKPSTMSNYENKTIIEPKIIASAVIEYYVLSNCGLLAYLVVDKEYRGKKLTKLLMDKVNDILINFESKNRNNYLQKELMTSEELKCLNFQIYLLQNQQQNNIVNYESFLNKYNELNINKELIDKYFENKIMNLPLLLLCECEGEEEIDNCYNNEKNSLMVDKDFIKQRHLIYHRLGFAKLPFRFIQRFSLDEDYLYLFLLCKFLLNNNNKDNFILIDNISLFIFEYYKATYYTCDFISLDNCYFLTFNSLLNNGEIVNDGERKITLQWNVNDWNNTNII